MIAGLRLCTMICRRELLKANLETIDEGIEEFCTVLLNLYAWQVILLTVYVIMVLCTLFGFMHLNV